MVTLANVMRANAISCLLFGLIFLIMPLDVANFLDLHNPAPKLVMLMLGAILIINGLDLIRVSRHSPPSKAQITTTEGIIATLAIAIIVALFGVMQLLKSKQ